MKDGHGRFTVEERGEFRKKVLGLLKQHPEGVSYMHLANKVFGSFRVGTFFRGWRGRTKPLSVRLTLAQMEKIGLNVYGLEDYAEQTRSSGRMGIYFHPSFRDTWKMLKPLEKLSVYDTPTPKGLAVDQEVRTLTSRSQTSVENSLQQEFASIYIVIKCPKCGSKMRLKPA